MCRDNAGWAMRSRSAALETVPSSATVMKVRAFRRFMRFAYARTLSSARRIKYWTISCPPAHLWCAGNSQRRQGESHESDLPNNAAVGDWTWLRYNGGPRRGLAHETPAGDPTLCSRQHD